jgi:hypothetical protein
MKKIFDIIIVLLLPCFVCCSAKEQVKLLNYSKQTCKDASILDSTDLRLCMQWQLDSLTIIKILQESKPTSFIEVDVRCSVLPCEYVGEAIINEKLYKYSINAGGFTTLWSNNNTSFLIYDKTNNFFLENLWDSEMKP